MPAQRGLNGVANHKGRGALPLLHALDGDAPALIGRPFFYRWSNLSIGDLVAAIRTTMPKGAPASLSPAGYVDLSAYLLAKNTAPSGDTELPTDADDLGDITVTEEAQ